MNWKCKILGHKFKKGFILPYCERCGYPTVRLSQTYKRMWETFEATLNKKQ